MVENNGQENGDSKPVPGDNDATIQANDTYATEPVQPSHNIQYREVGPYRIRKKIGEGGMGAVFLAEQEKPIRRRVALKVIKSGANSKRVVSRFAAERQALALMDHPNIAKILDAGTTDDGLPYFAMELVDGVPLHQYCDRQRLSIERRLQLFIPVCQAVQHAHQKGVIHRDLKPSNVLVDHNDGSPIPKVIDFGLAKAVGHQIKLTEQSLQTGLGKIVGTVQYMSPEQADTGQVDIDTRTDVYSLGVMLYELLTGSIPLDAETLGEKALLNVLEMIRDHQPQRPSAKLVQSSDSISVVSECRQLAPHQLHSVLKGDLDWIVMKAIDKDRDRRYESAISFAEDVKRYMASDVVAACPPTSAYRVKKFVARNQRLVATLVAVAFLLVAGALGTGWFAYQAEVAAQSESKQKEIAVKKSSEAEALSKAATIAQTEAEASAKRASEVLRIVSNSFRSTDPNAGADAQMKARDVLLNAKHAMAMSELDEIGKADLLDTLTVSFEGVGEVSSAVETGSQSVALRKTIYGAEHPETVSSMNNLAGAFLAAGRSSEAVEMFEQAFDYREKNLGPKHADTIDSMNNLGMAYQQAGRREEALKLLTQAFETSKTERGGQHLDTLTLMSNLALTYQASGNLDDALKLYLDALAIRERLYPDHPGTLINMSNIAQNHRLAGRLPAAIEMFTHCVEQMKLKLGEQHPNTLAVISNLANVYSDVNQFDKAIGLLNETLRIRTKKLGPSHPDTLDNMKDLAGALLDAGNAKEAVPMYERTLAAMEHHLAPGHPDTLVTMNDLARAYGVAGKVKEEAELHEKTYHAMKEHMGEDHVYTLSSLVNLAGIYLDTGRVAEAIDNYEKAVALLTEKLGPENPQVLASAINLGGAYRTAGKTDKAIVIFEKYVPTMQKLFGPEHPNTIGSLNNLAGAYLAAEDYDKAINTFEASLRAAEKALGDAHPYTVGAMINLASAYSSAGKIPNAIELFKKAGAIAKAKLGPEHPYAIASMNNLATAYIKVNRVDEAIELYLEVVAARRGVFGEHHQTFASVNSLASAYQANQQWEEAIQWYETNLESKTKALGLDHPSTIESSEFLASAYKEAGQLESARDILTRLLTYYEKNSPGSGQTQITKGRLGAILTQLGKMEEAREMLVSCQTGLAELFSDQPNTDLAKQLKESLGYLIEWAKLKGDQTRLEKWQKELQNLENKSDDNR